jgi:RimJ/RimL family protein N-acetyltransferase
MLEANKFIQDIINENIKMRVPIINANTEEEIGYLSPVTLSVLDNINIINKMTDWRNKNSSSFLSRFTATPERTKQWLQNSILSDPNRLLSLMYANSKKDSFVTSKLIGYLGFFNLTDTLAEGDAIIRGEHGGGVDFIKYANIASINWFYTHFSPRKLMCRILSNNDSAINMALSIGYKIDKEVDIYVHTNTNGEQDFREWGEESQRVQDIKLIYLKA